MDRPLPPRALRLLWLPLVVAACGDAPPEPTGLDDDDGPGPRIHVLGGDPATDRRGGSFRIVADVLRLDGASLGGGG